MKSLKLAVIAIIILGCGNQPVESAGQPATSTEAVPRTAVPSPPQIGLLAPDFTRTDQSGNRVALSETRGQKVVLVFYRGYW